jgi:hypothetical protein
VHYNNSSYSSIKSNHSTVASHKIFTCFSRDFTLYLRFREVSFTFFFLQSEKKKHAKLAPHYFSISQLSERFSHRNHHHYHLSQEIGNSKLFSRLSARVCQLEVNIRLPVECILVWNLRRWKSATCRYQWEISKKSATWSFNRFMLIWFCDFSSLSQARFYGSFFT